MGQIFISYSRRDLEIVNRLVEIMRRAGLNIWIDREEIKAGKLWRTQIVQAVDTCDAFVLMLSAASAASDNVRREIDLAQDAGRSLYILNLDQAKIPAHMRYQLVGLQFIDLQELGFESAIQQFTFNPGLVAPYMGGLMPTVLVSYTELRTVIDQGPLGKILP